MMKIDKKLKIKIIDSLDNDHQTDNDSDNSSKQHTY